MANLRKKLSLKVRHKPKAHRIGLTRNSFIWPEKGCETSLLQLFWAALVSILEVF
jgi:hypothetical protein